MVDFRGNAAAAVVCPLDGNWQRYFIETLRLYAAEGFRVVWIDDDIRYHNHAPLGLGRLLLPAARGRVQPAGRDSGYA